MYDQNNIFAKIIRGEISSKKVYEDEEVLAFHDVTPAAPVHVLVVPKGEFTSFDDFISNADDELIGDFFQKVSMIANQLEIQRTGYRIITNIGKDASQSVPHFHVHILGGKPLGGLHQEDKQKR